MAIFISFIGPNDGIGANEHITFDDHMTAKNRSGIDKRNCGNHGKVTTRIGSQHSHRLVS
ncbi:hypothetical protein [Acetobacter sp. DmW_136]|uniref:hypothetical protein n=1 Tax=Acetobacter sp. DmW_136 TaxID=2591091 RepID=UPI0018779B26|nr:hypothetical protein [Acetobacter sp. DmW_136]